MNRTEWKFNNLYMISSLFLSILSRTNTMCYTNELSRLSAVPKTVKTKLNCLKIVKKGFAASPKGIL